MATIEEPTLTLDEQKLLDVVFKAVDKVGATMNAALLVAETPFILIFGARP